jgi:RHS repeat-associated protein
VGGTITRTYDGFDRLTQEQTPEGTVTYTFDAAGRRATMTVAGQATVNYTWDNANRLTQIAQGTDTIAFSYDNADRQTSTTLANGVLMTYAFDNANQVSSITYTKGGNTLGDVQYTYDNGGRRSKITGSLAATDLPAVVASAAYNANNQLTSWGGVTQTFDLNGNLTSDGTKTYTWSVRDQLATITGGVTASFAYDGTGRRKSKTVGGTQTGFVYDGLNFVQELNGSTPMANLITGGIDELFQRKEGSTTSSAITDALRSVIGLTDAAGTLQTQYSFEPYGKATTAGTANNNSQKYAAREDDGTGTIYYRARYYMPLSARFISEDVVGWASGQTNGYAYVNGDPILYSDPLGLWRNPIGIFDDAVRDARGSGLPGAHNGPQDAYRHCLASCEMARENGTFSAQCLGWANEKNGDWNRNQERGERDMDDFNNAMGVALGKSAQNTQACKSLCMAATLHGQLMTYQTGVDKRILVLIEDER